jgi:hypothetical protein
VEPAVTFKAQLLQPVAPSTLLNFPGSQRVQVDDPLTAA